MRRAKSTQLVTDRLYRTTGGVTLVLAFLVAMFAADGDDRTGPAGAVRAETTAPATGTARHAVHAGPANGALTLADGVRDPGGSSAWSERSGPLAYLGIGDQPEQGQFADQSEPPFDLAPPPGYARDPHADRPTPQQLERLIAQSYVRSGSDGGGD